LLHTPGYELRPHLQSEEQFVSNGGRWPPKGIKWWNAGQQR
jgi:hypothetical protein